MEFHDTDGDTTAEPERYRRKPRETGYFSKRYYTDNRVYIPCPRVTIDGKRVAVKFGENLTPLDELAAPNLWTLPREFAQPLQNQFYNLCGDYTWPEKYAAADWLAKSTQTLLDVDLDRAYNHDQIRNKASDYAEICTRIRTIDHMETFCQRADVAPPGKRHSSEDGRLRRTRSVSWWTRRLFKRYSRAAENGLRRGGFIQRTKDLYSSGIACRARSRRAEILNEWIDRTIIKSDADDRVALREVYNASTANPVNRRNELMTRLRGMDELSEPAGLVADFYTLTLPSKYHAININGGLNTKYNGATVRDGQLQLRRLWALFRASAAKEGIFYYGCRVAEPHHDGTPHWHMVLYTLASTRDRVRELLTEYWMREDGTESGAAEHRIKILACDRTKGSAAGYLSKYIAKNIDGFEVGADWESATEENTSEMDATDSSKRVLTWAWLHGIRQFQFFGTARVGLWRELRALGDYECIHSPAIEGARRAADSGQWAAFVDSVGGVFAGPNTSLRLWKAELWNEETGELKCNQFGDPAPPAVVGIEAPDGYLWTRILTWRLEPEVTVIDTGPRADPIRAGSPIGWSNPQETSMYGPN